jgi:DNA-binding NtrC family response regulator
MESLSILVVDDDPVMRRLLQQRLKTANYKIMVAEDGHKAARLLKQSRFDVVLTDLVMPGDMGGIEVLELTKELSPDTEVVLITAHSSVDTAVAAMKKGAADYLEKPINFDELLLRLEKIANVKTILRNAQDIEEAMDITEHRAAETIQTLEVEIIKLRDTLGKVELVLRDNDKDEDVRLSEALNIIEQS